MVDIKDIHSLTDFQRNTKQHIERLKESGKPEVLTVNGRAEIVVQDADAYQKLLDLIERLEAVVGVRRGLDEVLKGRTKPAGQVVAAIRRRQKPHKRA